jgi:hypothetical protein
MKNLIAALILTATPALAESPTAWPRHDLVPTNSYAAVTGKTICSAEVQTVELGAFCWHGGQNANPTGGPVGESLGGDGPDSEGEDGGDPK